MAVNFYDHFFSVLMALARAKRLYACFVVTGLLLHAVVFPVFFLCMVSSATHNTVGDFCPQSPAAVDEACTRVRPFAVMGAAVVRWKS